MAPSREPIAGESLVSVIERVVRISRRIGVERSQAVQFVLLSGAAPLAIFLQFQLQDTAAGVPLRTFFERRNPCRQLRFLGIFRGRQFAAAA